jgi:17beta-estradiol 17-dehydrogenase / very-long-chain 3-oxoacyl-CoA reductase
MEAAKSLLGSFFGDLPLCKKLLLGIGALWTIKTTLSFLRGLNYFFLKTGGNITKRYGAGSWAIITGATDGIGKEFCMQLAKLKFNIVLVSRTPEKLEKVAEEIRTKYGVETRTISVDFSKCNQPRFFDTIVEATKDLDLSILVNNVGIDSIERFDELSEEYIQKTIVMNCWAMTFMVKSLIKKIANRKRGAVINLASMIGLYPAHHYNIYSASKAFVDMLSRCLSREYNNVDILSLCPSEVSTPMTGNKPTDIWTITTNECVSWALNDLAKGYVMTEGHWRHKSQSLLIAKTGRLFDYLWEHFILDDMRKERNLPKARLY